MKKLINRYIFACQLSKDLLYNLKRVRGNAEGSCFTPALPWHETNPCHSYTRCVLQKSTVAMFRGPGLLFLQPSEEPAMFLFN